MYSLTYTMEFQLHYTQLVTYILYFIRCNIRQNGWLQPSILPGWCCTNGRWSSWIDEFGHYSKAVQKKIIQKGIIPQRRKIWKCNFTQANCYCLSAVLSPSFCRCIKRIYYQTVIHLNTTYIIDDCGFYSKVGHKR